MNVQQIKIQETDGARAAYNDASWPEGITVIPEYKSELAAGCDLRSIESVAIMPGQSVDIATGIAVALPVGFEGQVRSRSGMWFKDRVRGFHGTIDADYRGEIKVSLTNEHPTEAFVVKQGDRVAQFVIAPVVRAEFEVVEVLDETERGEAGFGSTGITDDGILAAGKALEEGKE
jgi:dUTP pyrophosphatase